MYALVYYNDNNAHRNTDIGTYLYKHVYLRTLGATKYLEITNAANDAI